MTVRLLTCDGNDACAVFGEELPSAWTCDTSHTLWLDVTDDPSAEEIRWLSSQLGIHPLAITDATRPRHPPKAEPFQDHLFLLFRGMSPDSHGLNFSTIPIALFAGKNWLVTMHRNPSRSIEAVWQDVLSGVQPMRIGTHRIACKILRAIVDRYTPILLEYEDRLDEIEEALFQNNGDRLLEELTQSNSKLKKLRRLHAYHTQAIQEWRSQLEPGKHTHLTHEVNDLFDHYERITSMANLFHELTGDLINSYLSLSTHRLNKVMQTLTVFTVIFMPLTLLTGVYGMNFENMPELAWSWGYPILLCLMVSLAATSVWWFKRRNWL